MSIETGLDYERDLGFVRDVLAGDEKAASDLRGRYHSKLTSILCARGASVTEADDLLSDLWSDCFGAAGTDRRLLMKYQGRCALESWLVTVATNRLIDLKRRQAFRRDLPNRSSPDAAANFDLLPGETAASSEVSLLDLLRRLVRQAFSTCDEETLLMLKLVHIYQITQREIGRMWDWHESKVSRALENAREKIKTTVLSEIKRTDPWLTLGWDDFSDLCRCSPGLFAGVENKEDVQDAKARQSKDRT